MPGYVYLIGSRKFHWYKIGKSNDAKIRVSQLGILLPFRVEVLAIWKAENHHLVESTLHERYAEQRINGEWFSFNGSCLKELLSLMQKAKINLSMNFSNLVQDVLPWNDSLAPIGHSAMGKRINELTGKVHALKREIEILKKSSCGCLTDVGESCAENRPDLAVNNQSATDNKCSDSVSEKGKIN